MRDEKFASAEEHKRYMRPAHQNRNIRCTCGCKKRASYLGMANGICLIDGCELSIRRWIRDGGNARNIDHNER